jgi:hypothetical protein
MFRHTMEKEDLDSSEDLKPVLRSNFDPKSFLESLFKSKKAAEIEEILRNNSTTKDDFEGQVNDDDDLRGQEIWYKPDVYFLIGVVSFIVLLILIYAIFKAFIMLKISLNDGIDDTVIVQQLQQQEPQQRRPPEMVQSAASGIFFNGNFYFFEILELLKTM